MGRKLGAAIVSIGVVVGALIAMREGARDKAPSPTQQGRSAPPPSSPAVARAPSQVEPGPTRAKPIVIDGPFPYGVEVTDQHWSFQTYVHASLAPIRIVARGQVTVKEGEVGEIVVAGFEGLEVFWEDQSAPFQVLTGSEWYKGEPLVIAPHAWREPADFRGVWVDDFDFDGHQDIALVSSFASSRTWDAWLFDRVSERFLKADLPDEAHLVPEKKEVGESTFLGLGHPLFRRYRWTEKKLNLIEEWDRAIDEYDVHTRYDAAEPIVTRVDLTVRPLTDSICEKTYMCAVAGQCFGQGEGCVATPQSCQASSACKESGRCAEGGGECRPTPEGCAASLECKQNGECGVGTISCVPTEAGCKSAEACRRLGLCVPGQHECTFGSGCAASLLCETYGRCTEEGGKCVAAKEADCARSEVCREKGRCRALGGWCVAEE